MAQTASCPSCGAPVQFRSAASILAVCDYCQSTLVRSGQVLEDMGKMAALAEDRSPLSLGAEGKWRGCHFALIGRIQLKYSQGLWNEWYLLFDDMRTGWLSEAGGEYVLSFLEHLDETPPPFAQLKVGQRLVLASRRWTLSNIEEAECIAGQGELPFRVGAGYPAPVADLRQGSDFATLDYSEERPLFFVGQAVKLENLALTRGSEPIPLPVPTVEALVFRCPSCATPLQARSADIQAVACASCGAVVDAANPVHRALSGARKGGAEAYVPLLPLGSKGTLEGQAVEVIGFLVMQGGEGDLGSTWREYLLAGEHGTYRWLSEYNGHWNLADVLSSHPDLPGERETILYEGQAFRHFSSGKAKVIQVAGEFPWRVKWGEITVNDNFIAPPLLLCRERTAKEITWSLCRYLEPEVVEAAFRPRAPLPVPVGLECNQPNPWEEARRGAWKLFRRLALAGLLIQLWFAFPGTKSLFAEKLPLSFRTEAETVVSRTFEVKGTSPRLVVSHGASQPVAYNWVGLNLTLVNKDTGNAWPARATLMNSAAGSGKAGVPGDKVVFRDIPPGTYYLAVDAEAASAGPALTEIKLEVARGSVGWTNFVLLLAFLTLFPLYTLLRQGAFESRRWADSDHATSTVGDDDEDDD